MLGDEEQILLLHSLSERGRRAGAQPTLTLIERNKVRRGEQCVRGTGDHRPQCFNALPGLRGDCNAAFGCGFTRVRARVDGDRILRGWILAQPQDDLRLGERLARARDTDGLDFVFGGFGQARSVGQQIGHAVPHHWRFDAVSRGAGNG